MSMVSLGIVLLVSDRTGSYALAGAVSASFLVANAVFAVPQARLIDRLGQRRVLAPAALVSGAGLLAMMVCVELDQPTPWPHLAAAVAGATLPQIGSSIRARWSYLVEDKAALHTAYSFESVVDEGVFIVGPALVTGLATVVHPLAGLTFALVATVAGTVVLAGQRRTQPPATGAVHHDDKPGMPWRVLAPLIVSAFAMGALLGGAEVATVAFSDEAGSTAMAGPLLAIWAVGSLVSGVITGAVAARDVERVPVPLGHARAGRPDAAAALRRRVRRAGRVPVHLRLRDLAHPDRGLRVDRGVGAHGSDHRGHHHVHHRSRGGPGAGCGAGRPGRRRVRGLGELLGRRRGRPGRRCGGPAGHTAGLASAAAHPRSPTTPTTARRSARRAPPARHGCPARPPGRAPSPARGRQWRTGSTGGR